jgi:23S rRNA pseudouridine955/2504/2580 synthase
LTFPDLYTNYVFNVSNKSEHSANSNDPLEILFEDSDIILVNKPAGLPSQPTVDKRRPDLFTRLKEQLKTEVYLHHRLDRDTTGVILFAKSKRANRPLTDMFKEHQFKKSYLCLTKPKKFENPKWQISNHLIARRKFGQSKGRQNVKMFRTESGGDYAETHFEMLSLSEQSAFVKASPLTGRTHQIRVHCLHSGVPILGDATYGGRDALVPRLMLHAYELEFPHPILRIICTVRAPLPQDFQSLLKKWHPDYQLS